MGKKLAFRILKWDRTSSCWKSGVSLLFLLGIGLTFTPKGVPLVAAETGNAAPATEASTGQPLVPPLEVVNSQATSESEMQPYDEVVEHADVKFQLLPIPSGKFLMGSPDDESDRRDDESPQREVEVSAFWMSATEITWDVYDVWAEDLDIFRIKTLKLTPSPRDSIAERFQVSQPTKPYTDMSFGMGKRGYPAI